MANFWNILTKPFLVLAPMEDVTDFAFREIVASLPRPDVFFTEFISSDGLLSKGGPTVSRKLLFSENQRPIVAQIWGTSPKNMNLATEIVKEHGFDGVDINMGCPDKAVMKKGAGAAMCLTPDLAKEIIQSVQYAAGDMAISVKTRLGYNTIITEEWIPTLLSMRVQALTVHGRVAKQRSNGEANWDEIGKVVQLRDSISPDTFIIGNGDIKSAQQAIDMHKKYNVDGVMIGRGIFANPWVFDKSIEVEHTSSEYLDILEKHLLMFEKTWGKNKNFAIMKKFLKMYVNNFKNASIYRQELMNCTTSEELLTELRILRNRQLL